MRHRYDRQGQGSMTARRPPRCSNFQQPWADADCNLFNLSIQSSIQTLSSCDGCGTLARSHGAPGAAAERVGQRVMIEDGGGGVAHAPENLADGAGGLVAAVVA